MLYEVITGCTVNADLCQDLVFLGDGAVWIWNLVTQYYPHAKQIVDWYHAEEHLEIVAAAAFSDLSQRTIWLEETTQALWDGQVEDVIAACEALAHSCLQASQAATYFTNNMERMRYDRFRVITSYSIHYTKLYEHFTSSRVYHIYGFAYFRFDPFIVNVVQNFCHLTSLV